MPVNTYLTEGERTRLERAVVGVAGVGGLGSNVAVHLVRAGVKRLILADFDIVSPSNLNRQFFFRDQIGRRKVTALADNLRMIEDDLDVSVHDTRLTTDNILDVFSGCDIVVEAFDSAESKRMLLERLLPAGMKVVGASGLAGWGRSNEIRTRRIGRNLVMVGDFASDVRDGLAPVGPRVTIAAAMQANAVAAILLGKEL